MMTRREMFLASAAMSAAALMPMDSPAQVRRSGHAEIVVAGDSWASLACDAMRAHNPSVLDLAVPASTARDWATLPGSLSLLTRVMRAKATAVYLSIGALDEGFYDLGHERGSPPERTALFVKSLLVPLLETGITVVHMGYNRPLYPKFPSLVDLSFHYENYHWVDFTFIDNEVELIDQLHLVPEDYQHRVDYTYDLGLWPER